jgi:hypothetical protein
MEVQVLDPAERLPKPLGSQHLGDPSVDHPDLVPVPKPMRGGPGQDR